MKNVVLHVIFLAQGVSVESDQLHKLCLAFDVAPAREEQCFANAVFFVEGTCQDPWQAIAHAGNKTVLSVLPCVPFL